MAQYTEYHPLKFWLDPASIAEIVAHIQTYLVNNPINNTTEIETIIHDYLIAHPEIIGGVRSINGETGEVVLTADNINAGESVTIKDVLDSLQDQIDNIIIDITDLRSGLNDINISLGNTEPSINLLDVSKFVDGYYSSGVWTESPSYITSDYMPINESSKVYIHRFNLNNGQKQDTAIYFQYIYWFNSEKTYLNRKQASAGVTEYDVITDASYFRVMAVKTTLMNQLAENKGFYAGTQDTNIWVEYSEGGLPNYAEIVDDLKASIEKPKVTLIGDIYTIETKHAKYTFRKITKPQFNLDTWRLYSGNLIKNNQAFNMWIDSDAEGAIKIQGETDYVSGFHGSEIATSFKVFLDGVDITSSTSIDSEFNSLMFYVESDVYHCYQDTAVADTVAFSRAKIVSFSGNKVTISNSYIPVENLTVTSARIALFQCYKSDGNTPVFTDFSVNTDFRNYLVSNVATDKPADSAKMTETILNTTYGRIAFKSLLTSGQSYKGSVTNFSSQNRIKFYFDTISQTTQIQTGEQIMSQFEFEII